MKKMRMLTVLAAMTCIFTMQSFAVTMDYVPSLQVVPTTDTAFDRVQILNGPYFCGTINGHATLYHADGTPVYPPGKYEFGYSATGKAKDGVTSYAEQYGDIFLVFQKGAGYGIIDQYGNEKVPCQYSWLTFINENYVWIGSEFIIDTASQERGSPGQSGQGCGVIRVSDGKVILHGYGKNIAFSADEQHFIMIDINTGEKEVYDLDGNKLDIPIPIYEAYRYPPDHYDAIYVDYKDVNFSIPEQYSDHSSLWYKVGNTDDWIIPVEKDDLWGVYSKNYGEILKPQFNDVRIIANGTAVIAQKIYQTPIAYDYDYAVYDCYGRELIPFGQSDYISGSIYSNVLLVGLEEYQYLIYNLLPFDDTYTMPYTYANAWAQPEIAEAIRLNLIPATMQRFYQGNMNRGYFCQLAMHVYEELQKTQLASNYGNMINSFTDTTDPKIIRAAQLGIVTGYEDGSFQPNGAITRQEAATMLYRLARCFEAETDVQNASAFMDQDEISGYAVDAVRYVSSSQDPVTNYFIMQGNNHQQFLPNDTYTRQQAFLTVLRLYRHLA